MNNKSQQSLKDKNQPKLVSHFNQNRSKPMRAAHATVDGLFVILMLVLLLCSIYIKMDSDSVYQAADPKQWVQYKPDFPEDVVSFEELQEKNKDVIGWLTIYGTTIDYPLLFYPEDNNYYLDHNALQEPESSGSLFLDYRNNPNFTDFNNIIHGHHMAQHKMFGDLDKFTDEEFFQKHEFGNIYFNERDHSFQIISVILTDGYDANIYRTGFTDEEQKVKFINYVYEKASLIRGVDIKNKTVEERQRTLLTQGVTSPLTPNDTLLIFSTCNMSETNGRYIVIAKLLDYTVENPYAKSDEKKTNNERIDVFTLFNRYGALPLWIWIALIVLLVLLTFILYKLSRHRDKRLAVKAATSPKGETAYDQDNK